MNKTLSSCRLFKEKWKLHYAKATKLYNYNSIDGISFTKGKLLPVYSSIGGSLLMTSNNYTIKANSQWPLKNKLFIVYNIPNYNNTLKNLEPKAKYKIKRIREYKAYMADFSEYENINDYFTKQVGRKKIGNIKRRQKKLESCFNISYKLFYKTTINKKEYLDLMNAFKALLIEKFKLRKEFYSITDNYFWNFYTDTILPMVSNGEASLYVVYNDKKPISFYLCYHIESLSIGVIPVFDVNYYKFGLGSITIMNLFESLTAKGFNKFDFYKGEYGYKKDWCNKTYNYEYHLIYKPSILTSGLSCFIAAKFKLKQFLRQKGVNNFYYSAVFKLKNRKLPEIKHYKITPVLPSEVSNLILEAYIISVESLNSELKKEVYNHLYINNLHLDLISVFQVKKEQFIIKNNSNNSYFKISPSSLEIK
ncbi:GNAT family N-acetyltransferase [Algibacter pectinivorans]|uniref:Acetyltransferase (GNAT) domain-containing protein n=1 Tax=Algibacter pectinivorans TaxID=870482 RepID=A0A1I1PCF7_9FLAO|nr:GNAT family N-acetyltransferase [Algibacter pectinivorans]SFD07396.1 Acetyltransferase (GNAT) domain-containing protein [Algibacter pectinivorans]